MFNYIAYSHINCLSKENLLKLQQKLQSLFIIRIVKNIIIIFFLSKLEITVTTQIVFFNGFCLFYFPVILLRPPSNSFEAVRY